MVKESREKSFMLIGYCNGKYEFEDVSPEKCQYKIDIPNYSGSKRKEYLQFLEQTGISIVDEYGGIVYLRKNKFEGLLELYTEDKEINKKIKKRYTHFIGNGLSRFCFGVFF